MKGKDNNPVKTVLIIAVGFMVIFLATLGVWFIIIALTVGALGLSSKWLSIQIDFLWMKLARLLSFIVPNILLSIVFFIFLLPISLLSKLFNNKDSLKLKNKYNSYFISRNKHFIKESFERAW